MFRKIVFTLITLLLVSAPAMAADKRFTLVVDPGHGGHDTGAPGSFSKEKDLTLKYALAFGRMVEKNCPDVRVVYTRKTDVFLPLMERAEIANRNKADLFISFHINALDRNHTARGFQSYTLGRGETTGEKGLKENVEVAKRENAVIYLEKDYRKTYQDFDASAESDILSEFISDKNREQSVELSRLMQREVCRATGRINGGSHQNNLAVLRLTSMPAVLLELGFISTPDEERYLNSEEGYDRFTKGFYNAFIHYKNKHDNHISVPYRDSNADVSGQPVDVEPPTKTENTSLTEKPKATQEEQQKPQQQKPQQQKQPQAQRSQSFQKTQSSQKSQKSQPSQKAQSSQPNDAQPVFKVQLFTSTRVLRGGDSHFQGLNGCDYFEDAGIKKYTYGASNNYNEIYRLRKELAEKFPQCFIVAFKNGQKMDVNEGIREFKANRNK